MTNRNDLIEKDENEIEPDLVRKDTTSKVAAELGQAKIYP